MAIFDSRIGKTNIAEVIRNLVIGHGHTDSHRRKGRGK